MSSPVAESTTTPLAVAQMVRATRRVIGRRLRQHGVQRNDDRLAHERDQIDDPLAVLAAEEAVLVLHVERIAGMRVDELGDRAVRIAIVLDQARDDGRRIVALRAPGSSIAMTALLAAKR